MKAGTNGSAITFHESFTDYSESLFIENTSTKLAGQQYVNGLRRTISNRTPIVGPYNVNKEGSGDMYNKGSVILNMIRTIINDDEKWRGILRGLNKTFYHQTVTYDDITKYISSQAGIDLTTVFEQYLHYANLPVVEFATIKGKLNARWIADARGFNMPLKVRVKGGSYVFIKPGQGFFAPVDIEGISKDNLEVDTFNYYVGVMVD
jgi:aminopeptidase N